MRIGLWAKVNCLGLNPKERVRKIAFPELGSRRRHTPDISKLKDHLKRWLWPRYFAWLGEKRNSTQHLPLKILLVTSLLYTFILFFGRMLRLRASENVLCNGEIGVFLG